MTDTRDPRGIVNFFIRYLVLHAVFLVGLPVSYATDLALIYFFGFMGIFTFFQMLIAIPRKFLEKAGSWKPVAIAGALLSDVAVLWWLGGIVAGPSANPETQRKAPRRTQPRSPKSTPTSSSPLSRERPHPLPCHQKKRKMAPTSSMNEAGDRSITQVQTAAHLVPP